MKNFSNPWGKGSTDYNRWYTNKWIEGGEYYDLAESHSNHTVADGFEIPTIVLKSWYDQPNEENTDHDGEELLLRLADISIPRFMQEDLEFAMTICQDKTFSFEVFDQFCNNIKARFSDDQEVITENDYERKPHYIIGYDNMVALLKGTDTEVQHTHIDGVLVAPNVLRKNFEITDEPNAIGQTSAANHPVPLYQPEYQPSGPLIRTASYLRVSMKIYGDDSRNISLRLTVGELISKQ